MFSGATRLPRKASPIARAEERTGSDRRLESINGSVRAGACVQHGSF